MMKLYLATHNQNKLREIRQIAPSFEIIAEDAAVDEAARTFVGNARLKVRHIAAMHPGSYVLADDSGLEVDALGGAPGVRSARYAGVVDDPAAANNALLLKNLADVPADQRTAHFTCAMVLAAPDGREFVRTGRCSGHIAFEPSGGGGFGYDPLFVPDGDERTFAELSPAEKNAISHRGKALRKIAPLLDAEGNM
ncbi:MAG: RdgB/HAM1 family non-canonical purine NTP pyrophosphatase [Kiritimatiellae bacterium]|nr:RdgB/HAM1 family non-canonical purine NTP pyrophosphatase [Kiritimatiellia bacterium]